MNIQSFFGRASFRELAGLLVGQRHIRGEVLKALEAKAHKALVMENEDGRPCGVHEDKYYYLVALMHSFDRAIERGLIAKPVLRRLLEVLVQNVVLNDEDEEAVARVLGFRPPKFLLVSPTGRCNLRCKGCYAESDPGGHASLGFGTFDRILTEKRELWESHFTVISGGEPFLWRDGDRDLLDMVAKHPTDTFMVYTNSTLLTDQTVRRMAELGNITPAISVEGFEEETDARRGKGVYRKILAAFERLREHGVPFGVSATPTTNNWETITSEHFADYYFGEQGASYGWIFQYMPIGRGPSLDLMVTPAQRVEMLRRMQRLVRERQIFLADFWNSGVASCGCICAGRPSGYFYIDWNGDISPCAFVPFSTDNIYRIFEQGGNLNTALESPLFGEIRKWQDEYGYSQAATGEGNWLCPCVIRDHFPVLVAAVASTGAKPLNEEAAAAMRDSVFRQGLEAYGHQIQALTQPIWEGEYLSKIERVAS